MQSFPTKPARPNFFQPAPANAAPRNNADPKFWKPPQPTTRFQSEPGARYSQPGRDGRDSRPDPYNTDDKSSNKSEFPYSVANNKWVIMGVLLMAILLFFGYKMYKNNQATQSKLNNSAFGQASTELGTTTNRAPSKGTRDLELQQLYLQNQKQQDEYRSMIVGLQQTQEQLTLQLRKIVQAQQTMQKQQTQKYQTIQKNFLDLIKKVQPDATRLSSPPPSSSTDPKGKPNLPEPPL